MVFFWSRTPFCCVFFIHMISSIQNWKLSSLLVAIKEHWWFCMTLCHSKPYTITHWVSECWKDGTLIIQHSAWCHSLAALYTSGNTQNVKNRTAAVCMIRWTVSDSRSSSHWTVSDSRTIRQRLVLGLSQPPPLPPREPARVRATDVFVIHNNWTNTDLQWCTALRRAAIPSTYNSGIVQLLWIARPVSDGFTEMARANMLVIN